LGFKCVHKRTHWLRGGLNCRFKTWNLALDLVGCRSDPDTSRSEHR
jgi:hypothetical protein